MIRRLMLKFSETVQRFMYGRYGTDELSVFLLAVGMVLALLSLFRPLHFFSVPALVIIILSYARSFSKNFDGRRRELSTYIRVRSAIISKFRFYKRVFRERKTHKYFKCKLCKTPLRVPRGKGKIEATCPKCKNRVIKRT